MLIYMYLKKVHKGLVVNIMRKAPVLLVVNTSRYRMVASKWSCWSVIFCLN